MPLRTVRRRRMSHPEPVSRQAQTVWPPLPKPNRAWLALLPVISVALGGATARWSQGVVLLLLGGTLLTLPLRRGPGRALGFISGGLFLLALTAFLPAWWFSAPGWRTAMTEDFGGILPATLSPQPFLTAESLVVFAAGLAWFHLMLVVSWTDDERQRAGAIFAGGAAVLAVFAIVVYRSGWNVPGWLSERRFGPFPNRNQTADFFALAALPTLALARAAWRAGKKPAALASLAAWFALAGAVFHSFSRAGVAILFVTTTIYLVLETLHRTRHFQAADRSARWRRVAMVASLVLVVGSGALLFGGDTLGRFRDGNLAEGNTLSNALRRSIYVETLGLINHSPWCGSGLNTFGEIFGMYRRDAVPTALRVLHPESDWLWLAAELGWPGLLAVLAGVVLVVRRLRPPRHGADRPLRLAATLGVAGFLAHSLVDVSAHRVGSAFAALFLLSLALPERISGDGGERTGLMPPSSALPIFSRLAGGTFLLVGALWLAEAAGWFVLPGETGVARLRAAAGRQAVDADYDTARRTLTRALAWAPLDWQAYYQRGAAGVYGRDDPVEALSDFRRARYLNGSAPAVPAGEAKVWATAGQPVPALGALLEACRLDPANAATLIRPVYGLLRWSPDFVDGLNAAGRRDPALTAGWAEASEPPDSAGFIAEALKSNPDLKRLDDRQKTRFFKVWGLRGEPASLADGMKSHPGWQGLGWRWWATAEARDGRADGEQRACRIAARFAPVPELPPPTPVRPVDELRREAGAELTEPAVVLPLYRAERASGDAAAAWRTIHLATAKADCPTYFYYLEADAAAAANLWPESWSAWQIYLQRTRANE